MEVKDDTPRQNGLYTAYTGCNTRIVSLLGLDLPYSATEQDYKDIYEQVSVTQTPEARLLTDAITSVKWSHAPPVAFPTETVYGLGADATNRANVAGIFAAKGRPSDNPLIVHVASKDHLERLTGESIPAIYKNLVRDHWPGPLTILVPVPKNSVFAENVHPGQKTIGFRVPDSKYARFLIAASDRPIAAPSANSSGKPSPTTAQHVLDDLQGKINFILDGGNCDIGVESTVVDGLHDPPLILRPGGVSQDDLITHGQKYNNAWINTAIGYKQAHQQNGTDHHQGDDSEAPRAPGMKYKHYAPHGKLILFIGTNSHTKVQTEIDHLIDQNNFTHAALPTTPKELKAAITTNTPPLPSSNPTIAILTSTTWPPSASFPLDPTTISTTTTSLSQTTYRNHQIHTLHLGKTPKQVAQSLFAALRTCDQLGCSYIFAEAPRKPGADEDVDHHYDAVIERMRKAASEVVEV